MPQPDTLRTRLRDEINRRLAVARAATPGPWRLGDWSAEFGTMETTVTVIETAADYGPFPQVRRRDDNAELVLQIENGWDDDVFEANTAYVILHDPADAIRRYEGELEVLERHAPSPRTTDPLRREVDPWDLADCEACDERQPCAEIRSLAGRLGVSLDVLSDPPTPG